MIALDISHLTKRYGAFAAVNDVSLRVEAGAVLGLLGRNGAGKSTTISCALGLAHRSGGEVLFFGKPLQPSAFERVAYVPEVNVLEGWMTAQQHGRFRKTEFVRFDPVIYDELLNRFEIAPGSRVRSMSKGQRQAVAVSLAFAQQPDLLILDEPGSGLDPLMQRRLLDVIIEQAADGKAIIFSSHNISQVETAAERVAIMHRGRIVLDANLEDTRSRQLMLEAYFTQTPDAEQITRAFEGRARIDGPLVRVPVNGDVATVRAQLERFTPSLLTTRNTTLEQIFFEAIGAGEER